MKKRLLYPLIAVLIGVLSIPAKISNGCGYYDASFYVYSFVKPSLIQSPAHRPFFFTFLTYFESWEGEKLAAKENKDEWLYYFGVEETAEDDINYLIYKSSIGELKAFQNGGISTKAMTQNVIARQIKKNENTEFLNYILFAKACEPLAVNREFDWNGDLVNAEEKKPKSTQLIKRGIKEFDEVTDDFLKARYLFQIVRLARYSMDWEKTIQLYEKYITEVKDVETIINYWTREHYAGALYNIGNKTEAAYHFAQIFDNSSSRRMPAFKSFEIRSDEEWQKALEYCKDDQEKAALYSVRAINPFSNATEEMQTIFGLYPESPHLEFLLFREIQKLEYEFLGATYTEKHQHNNMYGYDNTTKQEITFPRADKKQYLEELITLVKKVEASKKARKPHLWQLAKGYLMFLNGENEAALATFQRIGRKSKKYDKTFLAQLEVFKAAVVVDNISKVDASVEEQALELMPLLESIRPSYWGEVGVSEQANYLLDKLGSLYRKQGEAGKAFLCARGTFYDLLEKPNLEVVEGLIALYDKKETFNAFEKELVKSVFNEKRWDNGDYRYQEEKQDIRNQLLEMKGTILLAKNQLEAAIATFEELPDEYKKGQKTIENDSWDGPSNSKERFNISNANPFHLYTNNNQKVADMPAGFNKLNLAKQLLAIEQSLDEEPTTQAASYLKLGNALYQMSHYGKSWRAIDYAWSVTGGHFMTNDNALEYLKKAIEIGKAQDRESAAKACFVASACVPSDKQPVQSYYFDQLKDEFSDTEFYAQAIKECGWFSAHVNK